jgi:putative oxidoreductase
LVAGRTAQPSLAGWRDAVQAKFMRPGLFDRLSLNEDKTMQAHWFIRIPFAAVFAGHGIGKVAMPVASAQMLDLPLMVVLVVGVAELLAGIGAVVGGVERTPYRGLVDRLTGLAAAPVLIGAIALVHWPRWSFVATESHPMGGMEFQVVLLGIALWFLSRGRA